MGRTDGMCCTTGQIGPTGWLIYLAAIIWAFAYDTIYAMVDRDDDLVLGVKSTAIRLGRYDVAAVAMAQALVLLIVLMVGVSLSPGWIFICLLYTSPSPRDRTRSRMPSSA